VEPDADYALLGAVGVGADPWLGDDARGLRRDMEVNGTSRGMPRCIAPGDAVSPLGFLGVVVPGVARLLLPGSPGSLSPPVNWGQVEDSAEYACSQVIAVERLLQEMLTSIVQCW
jgi:hypothetical protein